MSLKPQYSNSAATVYGYVSAAASAPISLSCWGACALWEPLACGSNRANIPAEARFLLP